jgi:hypothetical protein
MTDYLIYFIPSGVLFMVYFALGAAGVCYKRGLLLGLLLTHVFTLPIVLIPYFGIFYLMFVLPGSILGYVLGFAVCKYDNRHKRIE